MQRWYRNIVDDFYLILKMEERGKLKKTSQTRSFRAFFDIIRKKIKKEDGK